jgi:mannan endo-1,4-beta-mannosidase
MAMIRHFVIALLAILTTVVFASAQQFVSVRDGRFVNGGDAYYFVGANYWYGPLLGLETDKKRGIERLRKELDLLKKNGVTNLRIMAGAEGEGLLNNVPRVGPPLQPEQGKFDERVMGGLDLLLAEMAKRDMTAVIFLSNNWEWSGGFQQYLIWNGVIDRKWLTEKPDWDTLRDLVAKFYTCEPCKAAYAKQAEFVITRTNKITGTRYIDDPTIMAWQIANEPRPMRPGANDAYKKWIADTAASIKQLDKNHLVSIGHEGRIGTESLSLFEEIHRDKNIDYLTIHIWPKNWAWFENGKMAEQYGKAEKMTRDYISEHAAVARRLGKPLVVEEFGLPRDTQSFDIRSKTTFRDRYYSAIFSNIKTDPQIAGANFWAFGGRARPARGRLFWQKGDEYTGDPPMEEQGLYSVFDRDRSTMKVIRKAARDLH